VETRQLQHQRSLGWGAVIAPWVAPLGYPILLLFTDFLSEGAARASSLSDAIPFVFTFLVLGLPFTYGVTLVLVVPMALWLRANNKLSSVVLCVWCAVLGPVTMFAYQSVLNVPSGSFEEVLTWAGCGLITGVVFCALSGVRFLGWSGSQRDIHDQ
jgi:hypothetical protein